jgi:hypothetical protein
LWNNHFSPFSFASPSFEGFAFIQLGLLIKYKEIVFAAAGWHCGTTTLAPLALRHPLSMALPNLIYRLIL